MLTSGGPDCVVAAAVLRHEGFQPHFLHFNYGQRAAEMERIAVINCSHAMSIPYTIVELNAFSQIQSCLLKGSEQVDPQDMAGPVAFVPARNLILLSVAAGIAETHDFAYLGTGNILEGAYPDNQPAFTQKFDELLPHALSKHAVVRCVAPVNHLTKASVLQTGARLGVPFGFTWSCYEGGNFHCGKCASCVKRRAAFKVAEVGDPTIYVTA